MAEKTQTDPEDPQGRWPDRLGSLALDAYIALTKLLPVRTRLALTGWLARRVLAPVVRYHDRVVANLNHVWPDLPEDRKREIADQAIDNLARALIENYDAAELVRRVADYPLGGPGLAVLEQAVRDKRPVLLVSGHYGNPVLGRVALTARGFEVGAFLRPMSNAFANRRYVQNYRDVADPVFVQSRRGTMGLLRHLRGGGVAAMLFDVYDSSGVRIDFLGQPAPTVTSPADMALKSGAVLLPYFVIRRPDGYGFDVEIEEPVPEGDPVDMMTEATRRLEARIIADPGQWMWTHRRWKPKRQRKRAAAKTGP
ncbi:lysophospholipid acyltransferase family protein [Thalassococcus sp. BH17M4-6]|uniref:lysophospholipid acyltransferase family protein n=1 Tax=Thalassococcus sp. BH17M4-6 TaxID=3413148 RepID=UPI003BD142FA